MICCRLSDGNLFHTGTVTSEFMSSIGETTIPFPWLAELVLNYKLSQHVQFLAKFRDKFRKIDKTNKGSIPVAKVANLLKDVDPKGVYDHKKTVKEAVSKRRAKLTFTDAVNLVADAQGIQGELTASLLEAINIE